MESNEKSMNMKTPLLIALLGVIGIAAYKLFSNRTNDVNALTESISDDATAQATKLYGLLGVKRSGSVAVATPVLLESTRNQIMWIGQNIVDWKQVQSAFTTLCGGDYNLLQAASTALSSTYYNQFVSYVNKAVKQQRIFGGSGTSWIYSYTNNQLKQYDTIRPGAYVGRLQVTQGNYYGFTSESDGKMYYAPKDKFILKNA
jgi:hypothetical protein